MNRPPQAADDFLIVRALLEAHALVIHRLQELLRALEEELFQVRAMFFKEAQAGTSTR